RDTVEASVLGGLKSRLMDPALFEVFAEEFHRELNRLRNEEQATRALHLDEQSTIERRLRKVVNAITDGAPVRALKEELMRLEARQQELGQQLSRGAEHRPLIHPNVAKIYRRKVAELLGRHSAARGGQQEARL